MKNTTMTLKRSTVTLVVIAVLVILLPACGGNETSILVPAGAQAGDLVGLEMARLLLWYGHKHVCHI